MAQCRSCGCEGEFTITPELKHYGRWDCPECERFISWQGKPEHEGKRRRTSKYTISSLGKDCCELCRRTKEMLGYNQSLEIHHKDCNYENDVPENLLVLCTSCHKQVHHNHLYHFEHYKEKRSDPPCPAREEFFQFGRNL